MAETHVNPLPIDIQKIRTNTIRKIELTMHKHKEPQPKTTARDELNKIRFGSADATKTNDTTPNNQIQDDVSFSDDGVTPGIFGA